MSRRHGAGGNARQVGRHFMEVVAIEDWVDRNSFTDEKTLKRRIVLVAVVLVMAGVVVGCLSFLTLASLAERKRDADRAFGPLRDLRPAVWDNAFGVYVIEFGPASLLADNNVSRLLQLNQLPSKYELTLVLETIRITDAAIPTLAQLTSVDWMIVQDSAMTEAGIKQLVSLLQETGVRARHAGGGQ